MSDDASAPGTLRPSAYRAVLVSILLIAIGQRAAMMLIPLAVVASGGSEASASAVSGLRNVGSFAVNLPAGMLMAGYGSYPVMLGGVVVLAGGISLLSFSGLPVVFGGGAVAAGLGFGAWFLARSSYVGRSVEVARRGRVLATMSGFGRTGNLVAPVVAGAMVDVVGFGGTFRALALVILCAFAALGVFARSVRRGEAAPRKAQAPSLTVFVGLARSHARTLATGALTISVIKILRTFQVVLMPLWGAAIGLSATWIGALMSVSAVIDVAMAYPAGQLLDRVGRKAVVGMGLLVLIGGFACLAVSNSVVAFVVSSLMLGVGCGLTGGLSMILAVDFAPAGNEDEFLALWRLVTDLGAVAAPFVLAAATLHSLGLAPIVGVGVGLAGIATLCSLPDNGGASSVALGR